MDDTDIIAAVRAGDRDGFGTLVERYQRNLYYFVVGKVADHTEAKDIVQKTFVTAFQNLADFRLGESFFAWLRGIALNHCRNEWRRYQSQARLAGRLLEEKRAELELASFDARPDEGERRLTALRQCLQQLGPEEQAVIERRFVQELPLATIGEQLGRGTEAARLFFVSDSAAAGGLRDETTFSRNAMSAADFSRFDELVSRYVDDALTADDAAELVALLAEPPLAARFLEMTRLNSEIAGLLAAPVPDTAMVEFVRTDIERILACEPAAGGVRFAHLGRGAVTRFRATEGFCAASSASTEKTCVAGVGVGRDVRDVCRSRSPFRQPNANGRGTTHRFRAW